MCGIAGIVDFAGRPVGDRAIRAATAALAHRGPDGEGYWTSPDGCAALGHRRLSIIDTSASGAQPMAGADGRYVITYNGEIYNFLEVREDLRRLGAVFASESDTEVILEAFRRWGESMLHRFNGMWALAIFDTATGELFVARDRFGVKPLVYGWKAGRFAFASEAPALRAAGVVDDEIDLDIAARLLIDPLGVEGSTRTLFRSVERLQGGCCARVSADGVKVRRWWKTLDHLVEVPAGDAEQEERFRELFLDSVSLRMRSDVPIGACLSGGFDSSAVTGAMSLVARQHGQRSAHSWRHAFVASFPGWRFDERHKAELAAEFAGVTPCVLEIGQEQSADQIDEILGQIGETYLDPQLGPWLIYREVSRAGIKVTLDGHGADELLGGYRPAGGSAGYSLRALVAAVASRSPGLAKLAGAARRPYLAAQGLDFLRRGPGPPLHLVGDDDALPREWGPLTRRLYGMFHSTVLPTLLRNFDRASMAHGVEVRMPFMDWRLVCYAMSLPDRSKFGEGCPKWIARRSFKGLLPESIRLDPTKIGFNSPTAELLQGPLRGWARDLLARRSDAFADLVDERRLAATVEGLTRDGRWTMTRAQRLWPYLNLKHLLVRAGL